jgi:hypothetical protein
MYFMKKITLLSLFIISFLISATSQINNVSAVTGMTAQELRLEIARLTSVADVLRKKLIMLGDDPSTVYPDSIKEGDSTHPYITTGCLTTNHQMHKGHKGTAITALQTFLVQQNVYSSTLITGFFGPATQKGVQDWQAKHNIVKSGTPSTSGYGRVGPSTLRAMHIGCPGGRYDGNDGTLVDIALIKRKIAKKKKQKPKGIIVEDYSMKILPDKRGIAPHTINLEINIKGSTCTSYLVDWGDGSSTESYDSNKSTKCEHRSVKISRTHIYSRPGTFILSLKTGKAPLPKLIQYKPVSSIKIQAIGVR